MLFDACMYFGENGLYREDVLLAKINSAQAEMGDRDAVRSQVMREEQVIMGRRGTFHDNKHTSQIKSGGPPLNFGDFATADEGPLS